jgi:hypothetical protein
MKTKILSVFLVVAFVFVIKAHADDYYWYGNGGRIHSLEDRVIFNVDPSRVVDSITICGYGSYGSSEFYITYNGTSSPSITLPGRDPCTKFTIGQRVQEGQIYVHFSRGKTTLKDIFATYGYSNASNHSAEYNSVYNVCEEVEDIVTTLLLNYESFLSTQEERSLKQLRIAATNLKNWIAASTAETSLSKKITAANALLTAFSNAASVINAILDTTEPSVYELGSGLLYAKTVVLQYID